MDIRCRIHVATSTRPDVFDGNVTCHFSREINETKHDVCVQRYALSDTNSQEPGHVICCNWLSETDFVCSDGKGKSFPSMISETFVYHMQNITKGRYFCGVIPPEQGNQTSCEWKGSTTSTTTSTTTHFTPPENKTVLLEAVGSNDGQVAAIVIGFVVLVIVLFGIFSLWKYRKFLRRKLCQHPDTEGVDGNNQVLETFVSAKTGEMANGGINKPDPETPFVTSPPNGYKWSYPSTPANT